MFKLRDEMLRPKYHGDKDCLSQMWRFMKAEEKRNTIGYYTAHFNVDERDSSELLSALSAISHKLSRTVVNSLLK